MAKLIKGAGGKDFWEPSQLESLSEEALKSRAAGFVTWAAVLKGLAKFAHNHEG
jgi:hypothetical protein